MGGRTRRLTRPVRSGYLTGVLCGLAAAAIWASWSVMTRSSVTGSLDASDIAALRSAIPGVLLAPVLLRRGRGGGRLGWGGLAIMVAGGGAPYALVAASGLRFAPAYDAGALNPGAMPLFTAVIASAVGGERISLWGKLGLGVILGGVLAIIGRDAVGWSVERLVGDALCLLAVFMWACFTVALRQANLDPLHAAALVSTGSLALYLPVYLAWRGIELARLPIAELAGQALFQGVLVTLVALVLYGRAVARLGAAGGAAFGSLVPALSALLAIPVLGEWPSGSDWAAIALISFGVFLVSGGPMPGASSREVRSAAAC